MWSHYKKNRREQNNISTNGRILPEIMSTCTHKDENYNLIFQILKTLKKMIRYMKEHHKSEWETLKNEVTEHRKEPDIKHSKMKS